MDAGQALFISSRLILGAGAAFLAIMLWSKTRDAAWMLVSAGTIAAYIEIVYSILDLFNMSGGWRLMIGSVSAAAILLPVFRMGFFIAAFLVMVIKKYRRR